MRQIEPEDHTLGTGIVDRRPLARKIRQDDEPLGAGRGGRGVLRHRGHDLGGVETGHVELADIEQWNKAATRQDPRGGSVKALYDRQYSIYKRLYTQTRDLMADVSGLQVEADPGAA